MEEKDKKEEGKVNINIGGGVSNSPIFAAGGDLSIENQQINFNSQNVAEAFASIYEQIKALPEDPDVLPEELIQEVQYIEQEVAQGEAVNEKKINRWLRNLADMAPDIFDVTVATLINPVVGIAEVIRKIAIKAKEEYGHQG